MTPTGAAHHARRAALRERLTADGIPALLVTALPDVRYLTGFSGSAGRLLLTADAEGDAFVTDGRYAEQSAAEVADLPRVLDRSWDWLAPRLGARRLAVDAGAVTWAEARALQERVPSGVVPAGAVVAEQRQTKDDAEVALLRRAAAIADEAFCALLEAITPGMSERAVARFLHARMSEAGAEETSHMIVAGGANSARPHHRPGEHVLAVGDLLLLDFGCVVEGYHSDLTRTVALGEPGARLREVHALVLAAQEAGIAAVTDGAAAGDVDAAARTTITQSGYGEHFLHPTGHGLGLELHEQPILRTGASATLRRRTAVTVEPGIYLSGLGGVRIEDDVVTTGDAADVLTSSPRHLLVL